MIGELLGARYKVTNVLSAGGFGHTYIAQDTQRPGNPLCCIKHLTFNSHDTKVLAQVRRLFQAEAETLEQLGRHDQIPRLLAYFEENKQFYLVQEYIDGHPLSQELSQGSRLPEDEVIPLLEDVLGILEYVHAQGVIHRDIKPANLIRRRQDGRLVLIDFGAVKLIGHTVAEATGETSLSMPVYTSGYAASEQCLGRPRVTSDLYSLGMVGIQALTGMHPSQLPHDYSTSEAIWQDQAEVNPELGAILTKLVRYHFADRYPSASEALHAVRQLITTAPTLVKQQTLLLSDAPTPRRVADSTARPLEDRSQTRPKPESLAQKLLGRASLAIAGTLAIAFLVRNLSDSPLLAPMSLSPNGPVNPAQPGDRPSNTPDPPAELAAIRDRISTGDKPLNRWQSDPDKQAGIAHMAAGRYELAVAAFQTARQRNLSDPETLIYLNNARIGSAKAYQIAVSAPLETTLDSALEILRGVASAQDALNRSGGVNGVPLKVAIADDANQRDLAQTIALALANDPNVLGVIGHGTSDTSIAAAQIYQDKQLVMIAPVSSAVPLSDVGNQVFRTMPSDRQTARALKDYMLTRLKKRNVAIFYNSASKYSQSLKTEFQSALDYSGVAGAQVVAELDLARPDFDPEEGVNQAIAQKADVLMLAADNQVMDKAMRVIENTQRRLPILGGDSMFTPRLPRTVKDKGIGTVLAVPVDPIGSPFMQQSIQQWGQAALTTWRTALAYDATQAIIGAIARNPTRIGIRQALSEPTFSVVGSQGKVNFQEKGERQKNPTYVTIAPLAGTNPPRYGFKPLP
jgi:eukaryotic-like serine/threonine-protein kinase